MFTRRDFLKMLGSFGVFVLTPLNKIVNFSSSSIKTDSMSSIVQGGELYAGFLLLQKSAPVPDFIDFPTCPISGYIPPEEDSPALQALRPTNTSFDNIENIYADIQGPIFKPGKNVNAKFLYGNVTRFSGSGKIYEASYKYGSDNGQGPQITFITRPTFPRPYPVYPVMDLDKAAHGDIGDEEPVVYPEKISFTPSPGILLPIAQGFALQWIKQDVLYVVFIENQEQRAFTESFASSLVEK